MLSVFKQWRIGLVAAGVSLIAAYFVVSQIDIDILGDALRTARYIYILPCVLLLLLGLLTRGMRWLHLLTYGLPYWRAFHIMNVAYLVNSLLPFRIGEVARAYLATRADPPVPILKSASTIIVERLLDLLAIVMLIAFGLAVGTVPQELRYAGVLFGTVGFSGFLMLVFLSRQRTLMHRILGFLTDRVELLQKFQLTRWLDQFLDGLKPLAKFSTLLQALFWTAISWGLSVAAGYVLMYTFYENASWTVTCLYIAAIAFTIAVPAVPGNLGTYELSILLVLNALGYGDPSTHAVMFAVTVHAVNVAVHIGTGILGFIEEGISLQQLQDGVSEVQEASEASGSA